MEKHFVLPESSALNLESGFVQISTTGSLADGNMELGTGNMFFLTETIFPCNNYLHLKLFYFHKDNYCLKA